jgi:peptidoglycan/xylan/chitin deacetylase (PgdA/CDA1 family)
LIEIALRFDDPSPTSDHALEREIFGILRELEIPATVAVVPYGNDDGNLVAIDEENVPHLVHAHSTGMIEVAQHGYAHQPLSTTSDGSNSEFWGVPAEKQAFRIDAGLNRLTQTFKQPPRGFIPPWNTYDNTTASHLATRGFDYLSGSLATPAVDKQKICVIPRTCDVHQLRQAYAESRHFPFVSSTAVVIMHHYDFMEFQDKPGKLSLTEFRNALLWLKQQSGVRFITLERLAKTLGVIRSRQALQRHFKREQLHWRIKRHLPRTLLMTRPIWTYF